jgi:hypothetical protein
MRTLFYYFMASLLVVAIFFGIMMGMYYWADSIHQKQDVKVEVKSGK